MNTIVVMTGTFRGSLTTNTACAQQNFAPSRLMLVTDSKVTPDKSLEQHEITIKSTKTTKNGYSIVSALYFDHIQAILQDDIFDTIVIMRNDVTLKLNATFVMPSTGVHVLPRLWWNKDANSLTNNHLFILPFEQFMRIDFDTERIGRLADDSWDVEHLFCSLFNPTDLIPLESIDYYQLDGNTKFVYDGKTLRDTTFPLSSSFLNVDVLMIVKNEEKGIKVTLESILSSSLTGKIYIYDTGSTDDTIRVAKEIGGDRVEIGMGKFENFAQARNDAQAWIKGLDWILWLDANDTIEGVLPALTCDVYMICQEWHMGGTGVTKYFNNRLFRLNDKCRWHGYVHEWTKFPPEYRFGKIQGEQFKIRQDRTVNSESSARRWQKDIDLLEKQVADFPEDGRFYFYLGRTYKDVGDHVNAKKWLEKRLDFKSFPEERFWTRYFLAEMGSGTFYEAFEEHPRVEALIAAARIHIAKNAWRQAFMCLVTAAQWDLPSEDVLFVNLDDYHYNRWHLLGIVAYYVGQIDIGRDACQKAIAHYNRDIDKTNLVWYT